MLRVVVATRPNSTICAFWQKVWRSAYSLRLSDWRGAKLPEVPMIWAVACELFVQMKPTLGDP